MSKFPLGFVYASDVMYKHIIKDLTKVFLGLIVSIVAVVILTQYQVIWEHIVSFFA